MKNNKYEETLGFFPRKRLVASFVVVTMMMVFGTAFSVITVLDIYFEFEPEVAEDVLVFVSAIFCLVNFPVTRGSFLCAKILRYYSLALALICLPALILVDNGTYQVFSAANLAIFFGAGAFYLMGRGAYQEFVQNRYDFCAEMMEPGTPMEEKKKRSASHGKVSKKR